MARIRGRKRKRQQARVGAPDAALTPNAGLAAVSELCDRLGVIEAIDAAVGPVKQRDRGFGAGELLTGIAAAQLAGEDFLAGLDRQRADVAGQQITPVPGLSSTTAAGLARRITAGQWQAVEAGVAAVTERMLALLPAARAAALAEGPVTIDLDATDVEVYGRKKRGVAYNHQGQRVGRPHVAAWAETEIVLAADLGSGTDDPRASAPDLLRRALAACRSGRGPGAGWRCAPTPGTSPGSSPAPPTTSTSSSRSAPGGSRRCGGCWTASPRTTGAMRSIWTMPRSPWPITARTGGPRAPSLLIRRVRLAPEQVSADPRSRRRRTLHPGQRALPIPELAGADAIYGYSFILTNLDVSTPDKAAAAEHWYRHRTTIENIFRDSKHGAALRHLPSGYPQVNTAWMWGALLAASMAAWLHQLTAATRGETILAGHGIRGGKAMIATLRRRLIGIPGTAGPPRPPPDPAAAARPRPARRGPRPPAGPPRDALTTGRPAPTGTRNPRTRRDTRASSLPAHPKTSIREDQKQP